MRTLISAFMLLASGTIVGFGYDEWRHSSHHVPATKENGVVMQTDHTKHVFRHLFVGCMDGRVWPRLTDWIKQNWNGDADLLMWPGVSKVVNDPATQTWFLEAVATAQRLHDTTVIHLVNHRDCGGHGGSKRHDNDLAAERAYHEEELKRAAGIIHECFPDMKVHLYFIELDGTIEEISSAELGSVEDSSELAIASR